MKVRHVYLCVCVYLSIDPTSLKNFYCSAKTLEILEFITKSQPTLDSTFANYSPEISGKRTISVLLLFFFFLIYITQGGTSDRFIIIIIIIIDGKVDGIQPSSISYALPRIYINFDSYKVLSLSLYLSLSFSFSLIFSLLECLQDHSYRDC